MKVCFDFDQTLDKESVQEYAKFLIKKGIEVWICTARFADEHAPNPYWNVDLYQVAKEVGIPKDKIIFAEMQDKYKLMKDIDFIWHLDDDWDELDKLNKHTSIRGISVFGNQNWLKKCNKLLNIDYV